MNKHSRPNTTSGTAKAKDPAQNAGPNINSPTFTQSERMPDPDAATRETAKRGAPKEKVEVPAKVTARYSPGAAKAVRGTLRQAPGAS
ncbi:hypothetical protein [Pseudomonas sp. OTU5201]|uniref:hypothetical protein n=1 Tax=Pseudomonas sp. OTU5201 TaxID=3043850 RepID=UPI00313B83AD